MQMTRTWIGALLVLAITAGLATAQVGEGGQPVSPSAPVKTLEKPPTKSVEGRAALKRVHAEAEKLRGLRGPERQQLLESLARQFEAVAAEAAADRSTSAEAWFEAAELWRRHGTLPQAAAGYRKSLELDEARYAERALMEVAHMQRRQKDLDGAFATYTKVTTLKPGTTRAHEARLWIGRMHQGKGDLKAAVTGFEVAVQAAPTPTRAIEACDYLAKALIRAGDLQRAEATIRLAESKVPAAGTADHERLAKAAATMSARKALQRARDGKPDTTRDLEDVEAEEDVEAPAPKKPLPAPKVGSGSR